MKNNIQKPVILCIGTPGVIGDSLGPRVGDILINDYSVNAYVYGKTVSPVTGINCRKYYEHILTHHPKSLVVAVDACLGSKADIGKIKYTFDGLKAGSALGKKLGKYGDIGFLGVVAPVSDDNMKSLYQVTDSLIGTLSEKIAEKINSMINCLALSYGF